MKNWQVGDVIYRGDSYTGFIDAFKISYLYKNSYDIPVAHAESLFTGTCKDIWIWNDKNNDATFSDAMYSCDINRVYEFIQKHKIE